MQYHDDPEAPLGCRGLGFRGLGSRGLGFREARGSIYDYYYGIRLPQKQ